MKKSFNFVSLNQKKEKNRGGYFMNLIVIPKVINLLKRISFSVLLIYLSFMSFGLMSCSPGENPSVLPEEMFLQESSELDRAENYQLDSLKLGSTSRPLEDHPDFDSDSEVYFYEILSADTALNIKATSGADKITIKHYKTGEDLETFTYTSGNSLSLTLSENSDYITIKTTYGWASKTYNIYLEKIDTPLSSLSELIIGSITEDPNGSLTGGKSISSSDLDECANREYTNGASENYVYCDLTDDPIQITSLSDVDIVARDNASSYPNIVAYTNSLHEDNVENFSDSNPGTIDRNTDVVDYYQYYEEGIEVTERNNEYTVIIKVLNEKFNKDYSHYYFIRLTTSEMTKKRRTLSELVIEPGNNEVGSFIFLEKLTPYNEVNFSSSTFDYYGEFKNYSSGIIKIKPTFFYSGATCRIKSVENNFDESVINNEIYSISLTSIVDKIEHKDTPENYEPCISIVVTYDGFSEVYKIYFAKDISFVFDNLAPTDVSAAGEAFHNKIPITWTGIGAEAASYNVYYITNPDDTLTADSFAGVEPINVLATPSNDNYTYEHSVSVNNDYTFNNIKYYAYAITAVNHVGQESDKVIIEKVKPNSLPKKSRAAGFNVTVGSTGNFRNGEGTSLLEYKDVSRPNSSYNSITYTSSENILYKLLENPSAGTLKKDGTAVGDVTQVDVIFTQADIDNGLITYAAGTSTGTVTLRFAVGEKIKDYTNQGQYINDFSGSNGDDSEKSFIYWP